MTRAQLRRALMATSLLGSLLNVGCETVGSWVGASTEEATTGPLPVLADVPRFELQNRRGEIVSNDDLLGTPFVAAFMFARCPTVCPKVTAKMKNIADEASRKGRELKFVSFSVDGEHDTPAVLADYAREHDVDRADFIFLTGDHQAMAARAEQGFKIGVSGKYDEAADHRGITHGSHLVLIDAEGKIRGYYRSFDAETTARLVADLERL